MIIEVRLLVFNTELKTALYAPSTSRVALSDRELRPGVTANCLSRSATSASVRNALPALAADRSRGTDSITNHVPSRFGVPHAVFGAGPGFGREGAFAATGGLDVAGV